MKILLVAPKFNIFPVGIAYISASLKQAGHKVDCYISNDTDELPDRLDEKYDFVATGGLSSQFNQLKKITDNVKKAKTKIIAGGGIITSEPELMSKSLNVDYAIIGEGEKTINELLTCILNNGNLSSVRGIGYFKDGKFVLTESRKQLEDIDSLPWPDFDGFDYNKYLDSMKPSDIYYYDIFDFPREYPIITSRSCPYSCTFCYHPIGNKYRQRSIESIMEELESAIPKYRINIVSIFDELFSCNEKRVYDFCIRFKEYADTLDWEVKWNCQMRVTGLKDDMLNIMKKSGCFMVSYGFESYSTRVLASMKKHISPEHIDYAIHSTLSKGISIQGNFIFGDKAETIQTAKETLDFWKEHCEAGIMLGFIFVCPNSEDYQYCIQKGIIRDRLDFIKNHSFDILNMTEMSEKEFLKLRILVFKYTNKYFFYVIPLKKTNKSVIAKCPHCHEVTKYNNFVLRCFYNKQMYCRNCRKRFFVVSWSRNIFAKLASLTFTPYVFKIFLNLLKLRSSLRGY